MLRDLILAWVRANGLIPTMVHHVAAQVDDIMGRGLNCAVAIGHGLTRAGRAYILYLFDGELFVLELTDRQEGGRGIDPGHVQVAECGTSHPLPVGFVPPTSLELLEVDRDGVLDPYAPVTGVCGYSTQWEPGWNLLPRCALRVDCNLPGRSNMTFWHYLDEPLAPAGRFRFQINPIEEATRAADQAFRGTTVLLARLCVGPHPGPGPGLLRPISNLIAEVVELTGSGRLG